MSKKYVAKCVVGGLLVSIILLLHNDKTWSLPPNEASPFPWCYQVNSLTYALFLQTLDPFARRRKIKLGTCATCGFDVFRGNDPVFTKAQIWTENINDALPPR
jgi:hypothetical protein